LEAADFAMQRWAAFEMPAAAFLADDWQPLRQGRAAEVTTMPYQQ